MEGLFLEKVYHKSGFLGDLNGGQESALVDMSKVSKMAIVFDVASHASNLDITLKQSQDSGGTGKKNLVCVNKYYVKAGAATSYTQKAAPDAAQVVEADLAGAAGQVVLEVHGEDFDSANGFSFLSAVVADPTTARVASIAYYSDMPKEKSAYEIVA